jgi:crotonobetainyl-CoA:carnitine CoA-transferase CaiB-like acyl-CoA transferase
MPAACGGHVAVQALEPKFYRLLLEGLGLAGDAAFATGQFDRAAWPVLTARLAGLFASQPRDHWGGPMPQFKDVHDQVFRSEPRPKRFCKPSPMPAMKPPPRFRPRRFRMRWKAATCWGSPRPAPARPPASRCR